MLVERPVGLQLVLQSADVIWQSDLNFQAKAIEALQHASEDYLVHLFQDVSLSLAFVGLVHTLTLVVAADEFECDSRQASQHISPRHAGLAHGFARFRGMRNLIALCRSLLGASAGRGLEAATSAFFIKHFINRCLSREPSVPRESAL